MIQPSKFRSFLSLISFRFCSALTPQHTQLKQIHHKLIQNCNQIQPKIVVRMMHHTHFKSLELSQNNTKIKKSLLSSHQLQQILKSISSYLFQLGHKQLVLLLQTISQFQVYKKYSKDNQFMKMLIKRLTYLQGFKIQQNYIFKLLNLLQKMKFPPLVINRYIGHYVKKYDENTATPMVIDQYDVLRIFVAVLEMPFVPVNYVAKIYEKQMVKLKVTKPKQLCLLYYIYQTFQKSVNQKIRYLSNKVKVKDLIFNPYSEMVKKQSNQQPQKQQPISSKQSQLQTIAQQSDEFINKVKKTVQVQKIKQQICRHYEFEKYPFDMSTALLVSQIPELQKDLYKFFNQNYDRMQAIQFLQLFHVIPNEQKPKVFQKFLQKCSQYFSTSDKLLLLKQQTKYNKNAVNIDSISRIIDSAPKITPFIFQLITELSTKYLPPEDQLQIIKKIDSSIV